MDLKEWLDQQSAVVGNKLTKKAIRLKLLKKGERLKCELMKAPARDFVKEPVYSTTLTPTDVDQILSIEWDPRHRKALELLAKENPKKSCYNDMQRDNWWNQDNAQQINLVFRAKNLPWRIIVQGKWDDRTVFIGTNIPNENPLGVGRFVPDGLGIRRKTKILS